MSFDVSIDSLYVKTPAFETDLASDLLFQGFHEHVRIAFPSASQLSGTQGDAQVEESLIKRKFPLLVGGNETFIKRKHLPRWKESRLLQDAKVALCLANFVEGTELETAFIAIAER